MRASHRDARRAYGRDKVTMGQGAADDVNHATWKKLMPPTNAGRSKISTSSPSEVAAEAGHPRVPIEDEREAGTAMSERAVCGVRRNIHDDDAVGMKGEFESAPLKPSAQARSARKRDEGTAARARGPGASKARSCARFFDGTRSLC